MKKFLLFIFLSLIVGSPVIAQSGGNFQGITLSGRIIEAQTSVPLEYTNVVLFNSADSSQVNGTVADTEGRFKLEGVKRGSYYLKISFIGFEDKLTDKFEVNRGPIIDLGDFRVTAKAYNVNDVVIEGQRAPISYQIDKKVINVSQQLTSISGTAVDVLENVPSVTVDIEGNVSLRGSGNFTVLVDGRPSAVQGSEALQQIPSSSIENIEIMTNPSAKFNPEGTAGIINIVMKKSEYSGISGIFDLNGGFNDKYGAEMLFDYKQNSFQSNFGLNFDNRTYDMTNTNESWSNTSSGTNYLESDGNSTSGRKSYGFRGSVSFNLSQNDLAAFGGRFNNRNRNMNSNLGYSEWTSLSSDKNYYDNRSRRKRGGDSYSVFTTYTRKFGVPGHELTAEINYDYSFSDEETMNELLQNDLITSGQKSTEKGPETEIRTKLDYTLPLGGDDKFEAGYQGELEISEEETGAYNYDLISSSYIKDMLYSNSVNYDKNIYALYSLYSGTMDKLGYQFGFRSEYTYRNIELLKSGQQFNIDRWDYFPSAHFSYKVFEKHQFMTSYTRRINRPRGWELEPFQTWMDAYNVRIGNPSLLPEYIDSYELGYQSYFGKNLFSIETYYRITENKIERVRSVFDATTTLHSVENIGKDFSLGTELFFNFDPLTDWNVNLMGDFYDYRIEGKLNGNSYERSSFNWGVRFNNSIKLFASTQIQFNLNYNSPSVSSQGRVEGSVNSNLAIKQEFFNRLLSATLQIRDVFGTSKREQTYRSEDFYNYSLMSRESRVVMLNLRFNINNYKSEKRNGSDDGMESGGDF
ncbi:MAG: hypothetical protein CVV23_07655 [Ignavibacteriae bacterium HGW-Ignavibacteriae-2]|jgi:outer membrane receptor protein involved in Fe transport|nr:MAG: hypothetical protein CVV23_07655 [Ignavibacteriae bacterium HGW-Ignavibacteriae-2]